jgi:hypothetical protein
MLFFERNVSGDVLVHLFFIKRLLEKMKPFGTFGSKIFARLTQQFRSSRMCSTRVSVLQLFYKNLIINVN